MRAEDLANALCAAMPHSGGGSRLEYEEALEAAQIALGALESRTEYGWTWIDVEGRHVEEGPYSENVARDTVESERDAGYEAWLTTRTVTVTPWKRVEE